MQIRITKLACDHVHIKDTDGNILRCFTIQELKAGLRSGDDDLLGQMKQDIKRAGLQNGTMAQIKQHIEAQDYDL